MLQEMENSRRADSLEQHNDIVIIKCRSNNKMQECMDKGMHLCFAKTISGMVVEFFGKLVYRIWQPNKKFCAQDAFSRFNLVTSEWRGSVETGSVRVV